MNKHTTQSGMTLIELTVVLIILVAMAGLVVPYMTGTSSKALCDATDLSMQNLKKIIMERYYLDTLGHFPASKGSTDYSLKYLMEQGGWNAYDPETAVGWNGPYVMNGAINYFLIDGRDGDTDGTEDLHTDTDLTNELQASFGDKTSKWVHVPVAPKDQVVLDGWGRPIILQVPSDATCSTLPFPTKPGDCARLVSAGPIPGRNIQFNGIDATISNAAAADRRNDRVLFLQISDPHQGGNKPCNEY